MHRAIAHAASMLLTCSCCLGNITIKLKYGAFNWGLLLSIDTAKLAAHSPADKADTTTATANSAPAHGAHLADRQRRKNTLQSRSGSIVGSLGSQANWRLQQRTRRRELAQQEVDAQRHIRHHSKREHPHPRQGQRTAGMSLRTNTRNASC